LDLGTSGLKGIIVSSNGLAVAEASSSYDVSQPYSGWSEQDPELWITATKQVFQTLGKEHPQHYANIKGIAVSGQMHGAVVVDDKGMPLRPCILWNDMRSVEEAKILDSVPCVRETSGNIVFPGFTAPKLMWMAKHEPDLFALVHKVMLPKDYLVYWMTRHHFISDVSDAAGTSWLDLEKRDWSDILLSASGMRRDQMPDLVEGCERVASVHVDVQVELNLPRDVQVIAGGADNAVAACGVGAIEEGQGFVSLGSSGVILVARDGNYQAAPSTAVHTFCHALPGRWYQMGVMLSATSSLNWLAHTLNTDANALSALVEGKPVDGPSEIMFLPYLSGERTPHNDAHIGGAFIGLKASTSRTALVQAVMEGVCFALRDCLEALKNTGVTFDRHLLVIGGGARSAYWVSVLATILNMPLAVPEKSEFGGAVGAARLAMIGTTAYNDNGSDGGVGGEGGVVRANLNADTGPYVDTNTNTNENLTNALVMEANTTISTATKRIATACPTPRIHKVVLPQFNAAPAYEAAYAKYCKLYPLLKEVTGTTTTSSTSTSTSM